MAFQIANRARLGNKKFGLLDSIQSADVPIFLCPTLLRRAPGLQRQFHHQSRLPRSHFPRRLRCFHSHVQTTTYQYNVPSDVKVTSLPAQCAGCGALAQTVDREEAGYYTLSRKSVKAYLDRDNPSPTEELEHVRSLLESSKDISSEVLNSLGLHDVKPRSPKSTELPLCDRCHKLRHHNAGVSIFHPTVSNIEETISESPHKYNHVYHVIDAADFPMSLIPSLYRLLHLTPQRSLNRRSKTGRYYHGQKTEVSFIITRSDLLAPLKEQVDSLMPYLIEVLRDALGSFGKDVRLGNVRCVSAKRGWWTKELKEDIWRRGGGGWMVGRVNVGKSQLFEAVFPKGRRGAVKVDQPFTAEIEPANPLPAPKTDGMMDNDTARSSDIGTIVEEESLKVHEGPLDTYSLLPPAPPEVDYPAMPLVSALPGTTASPIRVPFGNGKGELVDLPGLSRGDLELHVQEEHRPSLVMRSRVVPDQQVIKPGQSLLLGGFIRSTPKTPDIVILGYAFTPISPHLTSTEKAIGIQTQERESGVENIAVPGIGEKIASAGVFPLKWDVTKKRSGPVTAPEAAGVKVDNLPYRIVSTDILIEGCGWVELVAQIRRKAVESVLQRGKIGAEGDVSGIAEPGGIWPEVEVFSPEGRFISARKPLGAWALGGPKKPAPGQKGRPRQSMKGAKKRMKGLARPHV